MAVEVKYVVIREGEEKMSFTSKKEAHAYQQCLIRRICFSTWLTNSPVQMEDEQREALSLWLAEQKDVLSTILKTGKLPSPQVVGAGSPRGRCLTRGLKQLALLTIRTMLSPESLCYGEKHEKKRGVFRAVVGFCLRISFRCQ